MNMLGSGHFNSCYHGSSSSGTSSPSPTHNPTTFSHSRNLAKYLEAHLKVPTENRSKIHCHLLSDHYTEADWTQDQNIPHSPTSPNPYLSPSEFLRNRHLILLSQSLSSVNQQAIQIASGFSANNSPMESPRRKLDPTAFILGLCVVEYESRECPGRTSRVYIQYVDTTGMIRPRSLQGAITRNLLKTYIRYARDILQTSNLHLFASPKPSLLFAGSEGMGRKSCLGGKALISWWLALLHDVLVQDGSLAKVYAYAPGEELSLPTAHHTRHCIQRLQQQQFMKGSSVEWAYGMPFDPEASALASIPAFEDDPLWRHLEALIDDNALEGQFEGRPRKRLKQEARVVSVREFMRTLGCRAEFSSDHAALIAVTFPPRSPSRASSLLTDQTCKSDVASCGLRLLRTVTFSNEQEAVRSTQKVLTLLRMMGAMNASFDIGKESDCDDASGDDFKGIIELLQPTGPDCMMAPNVHLPVVDLQSTVRRKVPRHVN